MSTERRARVQADEKRPSGSIAWSEHEAAHAKWPARGITRAEAFEREGGFTFAQLTEYLGHEPTTWRPARGLADGSAEL